MKKMGVVLVTFLFSWTVVSAQEANVDNQVNVQTGQVMKGLGAAESNSGASSNSSSNSGPSSASASGGQGGNAGVIFAPSTINNNPEYKTPLPNTNPVGAPWWMPSGDQTNFFNALAADLRFYARTWTRAEVEVALKKNGLPIGKYSEHGKKRGFSWNVVLMDYQNFPVNSVEVKLGQIRVIGPDGQVAMIGESPEQINEKFSFLGDIPVTGSKGKLQITAFLLGLKLAMDNGVDMVVLNQGMNTVYVGVNISPTGGLGSAATSYSFALVGGFASSNSKGMAEPVVKLGAFEKNGHTKLPVLTPAEAERAGKKKSDEEKGIEKKVNPDVLKSGVTTSPQVRKRAGYSIEQIRQLVPGL